MGKLLKSAFVVEYNRTNFFWAFSTISRKIVQLTIPWRKISDGQCQSICNQDKVLCTTLFTKAKNYGEEVKNYLKLKESIGNTKITVYITVTTKCDLCCQYCFENHLKREDLDQRRFLKFLRLLEKKLAADKKIKQAKIILFGGEPLLEFNTCVFILSSMKKILYQYHIEHQFSLTSNGMTVKKEEMVTLKKIGLENIQITFDGWQDSHDKIRKIGAYGYDQLLRNISWLGQFFHLTLKYNIRKGNISEFGKFVKDITNLRIKNITIKLEALQSTLTHKDKFFYFSPKDPKLADIYFKLAKIAIKNKIKADISSSLKPPCMATAKNSYMIEPNGNISACISSYNIDRLSLGTLKTADNFNFSREKIMRNIRTAASSKCIPKKCPYFPLCETGCLYIKEIQNQKQNTVYCREQYFKKLVPKLIQLHNAPNNQ